MLSSPCRFGRSSSGSHSLSPARLLEAKRIVMKVLCLKTIAAECSSVVVFSVITIAHSCVISLLFHVFRVELQHIFNFLVVGLEQLTKV